MNCLIKNLLVCLYLLPRAFWVAAYSVPMLWSFDLLNITTTSSNTDIIDINAHIIRLGRGRLGFGGYVDLKRPADDRIRVEISVKRSLKKNGPYSTFPVALSENLSTVMNRYYKPFVMQTGKDCCINCPIFEDAFVPPLMPVRMEIEQCVMNTDNMPNIMMEGYYWVVIRAYNVSGDEGFIIFQSYVEAEKFH